MPEVEDLLKCFSDNETRRRCNLPFDAISVTYEGYLSVENADFENMLIVGNLNEVSLRDAWYGSKMKEIRQKFIDDKLDGTICDGCVHHKKIPARPLMPQYSTENANIFSDEKVRSRIEQHEDLLREFGVW